jgi:hypothetical protein
VFFKVVKLNSDTTVSRSKAFVRRIIIVLAVKNKLIVQRR